MNERQRLRIGFIPLADATTLLVAVDKNFTTQEGLDVELIREVSWSNIRDKLNIGLFDAAHMIAPVAIASSLGLGHVKVPILTPFGLGLNGNAITVTPPLHAAIAAEADGDPADPMVTATALARVVANRKSRGKEPLTFGITFPYSTHNYHLRFWMAAGGVDPDQDVRLVVLPPPFMVESLAKKHVDGFCVGAPWNSCISSVIYFSVLWKRYWRYGRLGLTRIRTYSARSCAHTGGPLLSLKIRRTATRLLQYSPHPIVLESLPT
jgi:ABC-type nitrate/sulfonate/bicarbonate transport system substrate-binding protein